MEENVFYDEFVED